MPYTYETFRDYLQYEILQQTAEQMGWDDVDGPNYAAVGTAMFPTSITGTRSAQGIYDSITDEVLLQMQYSAPGDVPDSKLVEMRSRGRIEAWRAVAFNTLADTILNMGDSTLSRNEVNNTALAQLDMAEFDHASRFGSPVPIARSPRAATYSGGITVRW